MVVGYFKVLRAADNCSATIMSCCLSIREERLVSGPIIGMQKHLNQRQVEGGVVYRTALLTLMLTCW